MALELSYDHFFLECVFICFYFLKYNRSCANLLVVMLSHINFHSAIYLSGVYKVEYKIKGVGDGEENQKLEKKNKIFFEDLKKNKNFSEDSKASQRHTPLLFFIHSLNYSYHL